MYWNTVTPLLRETLIEMMSASVFESFRLVGGTNLSLQWGHRMSVDIDLFTDAEYGTVDLNSIDKWLRGKFAYVDTSNPGNMGMGVSYYVGHQKEDLLKLDLYYTDPFIRPALAKEQIRMADVADIIAMKLDIMGRGGRQKDFWDLHAAHDYFTIDEMMVLYAERYPYGYSRDEILEGLNRFDVADDDPRPVCLQGKHWELIKYDFFQWMRKEKL